MFLKNFRIKKGFTLVELMIVIAILGLLYAAMSSFNANSSISQQKVDNFARTVSDMIRDTQQDMLLGKINPNLTDVQSRDIVIKKTVANNSDGIKKTAIGTTPTNTNIELEYKFPFFDGDKFYIISWIEVSSQALGNNFLNSKTVDITSQSMNWTPVTELKIDFFPGGKVKTTSTPITTPILSYKITLDYKWFKKYIFWDAVLWTIMVGNEATNK